MSGTSTYVPKSAAAKWLETRLPVIGLVHSSFVAFPNPRNLNYFWTFGGILAFMLGSQILTGVILAMHYTPQASLAFASVEGIMRDVNYGWLLRYVHANGASMFFFAVYVHIFRGIYYGSYKAPREVLWLLGIVIYLLMMATGFMGYVLPWGQMSFWGATVITSLFGAIPIIGDWLSHLLWGGFAVDNATLNRFFSLHYLLPFMIAGVVVLHIWALHVPGSNNPAGIEKKSAKDTLPFHPYFTVKDGFTLVCFLVLYAWVVFYVPNYLNHADNYIEANPLVTPQHIVPEWYYLPFYAIPAIDPGQAARRHSDVHVDHPARLPALARHLAREVGELPSDVQDRLLDLRRGRDWARLHRLAASAGRLRVGWPYPDLLVFLPPPGHPPTAWLLRDSACVACVDLRGGAWTSGRQRHRHGRRCGLVSEHEGLSAMGSLAIRRGVSSAALSLALTLGLAAPLHAQDHDKQASPPSGLSKANPAPAAANAPAPAGETIKPQPGEQATDKNASEAANGTEAEIPPSLSWTFGGIFGHYDTAQLQRGYQVYKEVCSNCHSMKLVAFRNLSALGLQRRADQDARGVLPDRGWPQRQGRDVQATGSSGRYVSPRRFPTRRQQLLLTARRRLICPTSPRHAVGNAAFPLLFSTSSHSRKRPKVRPTSMQSCTATRRRTIPSTTSICPIIRSRCPSRSATGRLIIRTGPPKTLDQYSKDVSAFLMWAAEPKLEQRKSMGLRVMIFLIVFAALLFFVKKRIWARVGGDVVVGAHDVSDRR